MSRRSIGFRGGRQFSFNGRGREAAAGFPVTRHVRSTSPLRVPEILVTPFPEILITSVPEILAVLN
jgi:hypothetical protein